MESGRNLLLQTASILVLSAGVAFAQSEGIGNEDDPDAPLPGMVQNTDDATTTNNEAAEMLAPSADAAAEAMERGIFMDDTTAAALTEWKLSDYQGATVISDTGETVGTVEKLAYDNGEVVYLVVEPSGDIGTTGHRLIPLNQVAYDSSMQALTLDTMTTGTVETMPPYEEGGLYTEITSDALLGEFSGSPLQGSSEINSN